MTKAKTTRHALLMSALSMMLCMAMLVSSTFAWFTDSVTSANNRIVAGNLDVELYHTNSAVTNEKVTADTKLFLDKDGHAGEDDNGGTTFQWEPGTMVYENFTVRNEGSLALKYKLTLNAECNEVDGKSLKDVLKVAVLEKAFSGDRDVAQGLAFDKTLEDFEKTGNLVADAENTYAVIVWWQPSDKDDDYNFNNDRKDLDPLSVALKVDLIAMQAVSESDSFGNEYDTNANGEPDHPDWSTVTSNKTTARVNPNGDTQINAANIRVSVPQAATEGDSVTVTIEPTDTPANITVTSNQAAKAFEISVDGLKKDNNELITVSLLAGKDLTNVKLYHNDEEITDKEYDPATGIITFQTKSFSPYTVVYDKTIIKVSNQDELLNAIDNYRPGEVIQFTKNISTSYGNFKNPGGGYFWDLNSDDTIEIDLNGYKFTSSNTLRVQSGGIIINGKSGSTFDTLCHIYSDSIFNGDATYTKAIQVMGKDNKLEVNGGKFTYYNGIKVDGTNKLVFNNGTTEKITCQEKDGVIEINGGTVTKLLAQNGCLIITGGTITDCTPAPDTKISGGVFDNTSGFLWRAKSCTVTGGKFKVDVSKYVDLSAYNHALAEDGYYTVTAK